MTPEDVLFTAVSLLLLLIVLLTVLTIVDSWRRS